MGKITSGASPSAIAHDLRLLVTWDEDGLPPSELAALLDQRLRPHLVDYDSPGFQSMFNAAPLPEALVGAHLMVESNQGVTNWQVSPGGAVLEELAAAALCRLFGLAETAGATFMYSGTYANQQALYLALHRAAERQGFDLGEDGLRGFGVDFRPAVLVSADAHFSLRHAVRMLGLGEQALIRVPVDARRRLDAPAAHAAGAAAQRRGETIVAVVGTAGTTSTGAVDPLEQLAELAFENDAWFHVDGAYGYAYKLVPAAVGLFAGDALADSITWDPHKQLGVPIPNSLLFVRDAADFGRMALYSGYFNRPEDEAPNPGLKSPPSTRPLAALPLVTLLRGRGLSRVRADLAAPLAVARALYDEVRRRPRFTPLHEPDTGIVCFRAHRGAWEKGESVKNSDGLQRRLYERVMASGERTISTTTLDGRTALRLAVVRPQTTAADLLATLDYLDSLLEKMR